MGDLLPRVLHDRVRGVHKLIETEFVKESVGLLSVSIEDGQFFSLEGFFIPSNLLWLQGAMWLISLRVVYSVTWATTGISAGSRHKSK